MSGSITSLNSALAQYQAPVMTGKIQQDISQLTGDLQAFSGSLGGSAPAASTTANSSLPSTAQTMQEMMQLLSQMTSGQGAPSQSASQGQGAGNQTPAPATAYNKLMEDLSASGTSAQAIQQDGQNVLSALQQSGGGGGDLANAVNSMVGSLSNGTFSQQGSQGALEGAAAKDGLTNVDTPQIDGNAVQAYQSAGDYDGGNVGSLNANLNILKDEITANPSDLTQVHNNAQALANEAANSGNTDLANAARNIASSTQDGTYNGAASLQALQNAGGQTTAQAAPGTSAPATSTPSTSTPAAGGSTQMLQEMMQLLQQLLQMMEGGQGAQSGAAPGGQSAGGQPASGGAPAGGPATSGGQPVGAGTSAGGPQMEQEMMQMLQTMLSMMQQMSSGGTSSH